MGIWTKLFGKREAASRSASSRSAPSPAAATDSTDSSLELVVFPYGCPNCRTNSKLVLRGTWEFCDSGVFFRRRHHQQRRVRYTCPDCRTTFEISQDDDIDEDPGRFRDDSRASWYHEGPTGRLHFFVYECRKCHCKLALYVHDRGQNNPRVECRACGDVGDDPRQGQKS